MLEQFPIVKRKDIAAHGTFRTKETILSIYDAMQRAIATGEPYQTLLDPPPANGWEPEVASGEWRTASGGPREAGRLRSREAGSERVREAGRQGTASSKPRAAQPSLDLPVIELDFDTAPQPRGPSIPESLVPSVPHSLPPSLPHSLTRSPAAPHSPLAAPHSLSPGDSVLVNDTPATLIAMIPGPSGATLYTVRLEGETTPRKFMSPPARVEAAD
jgi:hypothetical protein